MELVYRPSNTPTRKQLLNIDVVIKGTIDSREYSDMIILKHIDFRISDTWHLSYKAFVRWMKDHHAVDHEYEFDEAMKQVARLIDPDSPLTLGKSYAFTKASPDSGTAWVMDIKWQLVEVDNNITIKHRRTVEELAPSVTADVLEINRFLGGNGEFTRSADEINDFYKRLAYWSRLHNYRPSDNIEQNDLVAFYYAWEALDDKEREAVSVCAHNHLVSQITG